MSYIPGPGDEETWDPCEGHPNDPRTDNDWEDEEDEEDDWEDEEDEEGWDAFDLIRRAVESATRQMRVCKLAPTCPKCRARQVQILCSLMLAKWKCRECRHTWRHEPIISSA